MLEGVVAGRAWGSAEVQGGVVLGIVFRLRLVRFSVWARLDLIQLLLLLSLSMTSLVARHAIGDGRHSRPGSGDAQSRGTPPFEGQCHTRCVAHRRECAAAARKRSFSK